MPLIVGLGMAAKLAAREAIQRAEACRAYRKRVLEAFTTLELVINGDPSRTMPHVLNITFPGLDSEAVMVALKDVIAISNGSACTSQSYEPSHVLKAMGLPNTIMQGALRLSWCHMTEEPNWDEVVKAVKRLD